MTIIEKNEGKKIDYALKGTKLQFADGALTIDLARYQQDDPVVRDIMVDGEGYLTMGQGRYYVAQVEIPARDYSEAEIDAQQMAGLSDMSEASEYQEMPLTVRTPLPLNTDEVTLHLFGVDGVIIN